jgi:hypothetical protein
VAKYSQVRPAAALRSRLEQASRKFRRRRMCAMVRLLGLTERCRVLDVGGTLGLWRLAPVMPRLVLLNQSRAAADIGSGARVVFGDGLALPFPEASFDVVFSNSVIEHVGGTAAQEMFAREVARVGLSYWVQTPDRTFPLEQHLWTPGIHWLPRTMQRRLLKYPITPWEWAVKPDSGQRDYYLSHYCESVHLLNRKSLQRLFPDASLLVERAFGWPKSLIVYRRRL